MDGVTYDGWELVESGPAGADRTVLLLAGAMCPAGFYAQVMAEPALTGVRLVAATLPGFAGSRAPDDLSLETHARYGAQLAAKVGADVVVGHSLGANHVLEMAALQQFSGPIVLLSPSFSKADEMKELKQLSTIGSVPGLGPVAWRLALKVMPKAMAKPYDEPLKSTLIAGLRSNDPVFCRAVVPDYFAYLDRHGELATRLCTSGARAWVAFGDHEDVGLADDERATLDACPTVTLLTIPDATHMTMLDQPAAVADVVALAVASS